MADRDLHATPVILQLSIVVFPSRRAEKLDNLFQGGCLELELLDPDPPGLPAELLRVCLRVIDGCDQLFDPVELQFMTVGKQLTRLRR